MLKSFIPYELAHSLLVDSSTDELPTLLQTWNEGVLNLPTIGTHYGYVWRGEPIITSDAGTFTLQPGMYFSIPGNVKLLGSGQGIVVTRLRYQGIFSIGGPIELTGRLLYIDGCRDSLLIPPVMKGDPCFNALYFPAGIDQTPYTHPSMQVGMIVSGRGECLTENEIFSLTPGQVFVIFANGLHSFKTLDSSMVVVAWHPDSDYGPTDKTHPMINKTMVNGIRASQLEEIRTRG